MLKGKIRHFVLDSKFDVIGRHLNRESGRQTVIRNETERKRAEMREIFSISADRKLRRK